MSKSAGLVLDIPSYGDVQNPATTSQPGPIVAGSLESLMRTFSRASQPFPVVSRQVGQSSRRYVVCGFGRSSIAS